MWIDWGLTRRQDVGGACFVGVCKDAIRQRWLFRARKQTLTCGSVGRRNPMVPSYSLTPLHSSVFPNASLSTANLRTKILDFKVSDSSRILIWRGGIPRPIGNYPEGLSQAILAEIFSGGRLRGMKLSVVNRSTNNALPRTTSGSLEMPFRWHMCVIRLMKSKIIRNVCYHKCHLVRWWL